MDRVFITYCLFILFCSVPNHEAFTVDKASKSIQSASTKHSEREVSGTRLQSPISQFLADTSIDRDESLNDRDLSDSPKLFTPSPCPGDALFCESADDYPQDIIKEVLKKSPELLIGSQYERETSKLRQKRFGPEYLSQTELCTSKNQIVFPNKAKSKDGGFEFVINDEEHRQGIRVETCMSKGSECNLPGASISYGYKYTCIQKYITRQLSVLNQDSSSGLQGIVVKPFDFPSSCSCVVSRQNSEESITPANKTAPSTTVKPVEGQN